MERNSIGLIELGSIASGFEVADAMLKAANVDILLARSICSGKYIVMVAGDVAAVESSVHVGTTVGHANVIDTFVIPNVHPDVFPAISGANEIPMLGALGIIESFSVASLIEAADEAAKTADVKIMEIRLAMALGGKAFLTLTGDVAAVQSAVDAGSRVVGAKGLLVNAVVIPGPRKELLTEIV